MKSQNGTDSSYAYSSAIFKHMPIGVALFDVHDLRLLITNSRFESFLEPAWQQGRAIGHPLIEWVPGWVPDTEVQYLLDVFQKVKSEGVPHRAEERSVTHVGEGTTSYWSWTLEPVYDETGALIQLLLTENDVTSYVLARQQAEREQDRLHAILDQLPEGITLVEADGSLSYMNCAAEHLLQVSPESHWNALHDRDPLAQSVKDLKGQNLSSKDFLLLHALHGETITGRETVITRPDNSSIVLMTSCAPLYNKEQEIMGAVSVFQDVTLRKNMEQQKSEFLSLASHELRTPITSIQGLAEILHMHVQSGKSLDSPRSHHAIEEVIGQSRQLAYLIDGMLDISRLENMQLELQIVSNDVVSMLKRVVESHAMTSKYHPIHFVIEGLQAHETLMGCFDEQRMTQAMNNLINNAIKYSPKGSIIEVGLHWTLTQPEQALLWVKDFGVGIPQSELNSIFDRFYRVSSTDRSIGGLGVGLYLVREIVTRHDGRVWAESVEGKGSTFYVLLPLKPSAD